MLFLMNLMGHHTHVTKHTLNRNKHDVNTEYKYCGNTVMI